VTQPYSTYTRPRPTSSPSAWRRAKSISIACGRRHFGAIEVDYDDVTSVEELRERFLRPKD
jgi:hypothetical protein